MSKARGPYRVDPLGYKKKADEALNKKAENARELGLDYAPAQQEAKIVRWNCPCGNKYTFHGFTEAPPHRTWVGLTDAEVIKTFNAICNGKPFDVERILELHRAIEAKLRGENT